MAETIAVGTYCLEYKRGDSFVSQFRMVNNLTDKVVVDITGWNFDLTVDTLKNPPDSATNVFTVIGVIDDAVNGLFSFAPSQAQTDIVPVNYWYDIQVRDAAGRKRTPFKDRFRIVQDITKT